MYPHGRVALATRRGVYVSRLVRRGCAGLAEIARTSAAPRRTPSVRPTAFGTAHRGAREAIVAAPRPAPRIAADRWTPLGDHLRELGIAETQVAEALEEQRWSGRRIGEILVSRRVISTAELNRALGEQRRSGVRLDVIIPAYNEERRIGKTLSAYRSACSLPGVSFVVALDGCKDGTADVVRAHASSDPRVRLLDFPKLGKGGVLMEAFRRCSAELIGFVDADCATSPTEFLRLVAAMGDFDLAIASRRHPAAVLPVRRSIARRITSTGFAMGTQRLFGLPVLDTQCGAKVMHREVAERAIPLLSSRDFLFDVDLLVTAQALGYRIAEVPTVWVDRAGSHVSAVGDARKMMVSSLRLWLHHRVIPVPRPGPTPRETVALDAPPMSDAA
jgi:hypothetical protein